MAALTAAYPARRGPDRIGYRELQGIADDIKRLSHYVSDRAKADYKTSYPAFGEREAREALGRLGNLEEAAEAFDEQVEKYRGDIGHIDEEYSRLRQAYYHARHRIRYFGSDVRGNFERIGQLIDRLSFIAPDQGRDRWD